jgi:hypothetical protein
LGPPDNCEPGSLCPWRCCVLPDRILADHAKDLAQGITEKDGKSYPFKVGVAKADQVKPMVNFAVEKTGALHGIVKD